MTALGAADRYRGTAKNEKRIIEQSSKNKERAAACGGDAIIRSDAKETYVSDVSRGGRRAEISSRSPEEAPRQPLSPSPLAPSPRG
ncbi:unnamed protein product, partial [Iphiclides podalirius]